MTCISKLYYVNAAAEEEEQDLSFFVYADSPQEALELWSKQEMVVDFIEGPIKFLSPEQIKERHYGVDATIFEVPQALDHAKGVLPWITSSLPMVGGASYDTER